MNLENKEPIFKQITYSDVYVNDLAMTLIHDVLRLMSVKEKDNKVIDDCVTLCLQSKALLKALFDDNKAVRLRLEEKIIENMQLKRELSQQIKINKEIMKL